MFMIKGDPLPEQEILAKHSFYYMSYYFYISLHFP